MRKRMVALLLVLALVACAAIGLAACNEGGKDGEGDRIFTEGKTAQEIQDALIASSGYVLTNDESTAVLYV